MSPLRIAPSILAGDFGHLSQEAQKAENCGADLLHIDVMDGNFVPNITLGPQAISAIRRSVQIPLDVHLMISSPKQFIDPFIDAGSDYLTLHFEADNQLDSSLKSIRARNIKAGVSINPDTPVEVLFPFLSHCDLVLIMSVFPGFGGQKFLPEVLSKIRTLVEIRKQKSFSFEIEIDGGINQESAVLAKEAGIDIAVSGTALYGSKDMKKAIHTMKYGK